MDNTVEPTMSQVEAMLRQLVTRGTPGRITVQFSGGEPTLREDLPDMIRLARRYRYGRIEINSHGLRLATEPGYAENLKSAGLDAIGLQFDGLDDEVYQFNRGAKLLAQKQRAIDAARRAGLSVVLVVTLSKGVNDNQVGEIIRFAARNRDVVRRVVAQTLTFYGRATEFDVNRFRSTPYDFMRLLEEQTNGAITVGDFYPVAAMFPIADFFEQLTGQAQEKLYTHPCCNVATYIHVGADGGLVPLNKLLHVEPLLRLMARGASEMKSATGWHRVVTKWKYVLKLLWSSVTQVTSPVFRQVLLNSLLRGSHDPMEDLANVLMVSCVHHMDKWNFDVERVETCSIHYLTSDGNQVPFCSYNTFYRRPTERAIASGRSITSYTKRSGAPSLIQINGAR